MSEPRPLWLLLLLILGPSIIPQPQPGQASPEPDPAFDINRVPQLRDEDKCYDVQGKAQRCIPPFENAAFNVQIEATNTCGKDGRPTPYCKQTGLSGIHRKSCDTCLEGDHPASFLTDHDTSENATWWQSQTMFENVQYPNHVNLTLKLGKTFDITYVRVLFESPRPESWAIYKRKNEKSQWEPYQYYSATCRDTYGQPESKETTSGDDTRVLCTSEYSDIVPLSKGTVAFSTLEGRPNAYFFDTNTELQEWVQATELRITLDRLNTFGDEVFGDDQVLQSYYYAIADVAVGARCACNGHAGQCNTTIIDGQPRRICNCEHRTTGPDCNECQPFYNDAPWGRASTQDAHECKECNCNGYSDRCYFDKELYRATGHGGHCLDCRDNRDGANCELCRENFYARPEDGYCVACNCDETGSRSLQCNTEGKCQCKPGVTGDKCDRCAPNFYEFSGLGCISCKCNEAGSLDNTPNCDPYTGKCTCKDNVEGKRCDDCRPGYFNLALNNEFGCTPCFCYGHSSTCSMASGYSKANIESPFVRGNERWSASIAGSSVPVTYDALNQAISVATQDRDNVYFVAPDRYLGDQRASYKQDLSFSLKIDGRGAAPTPRDIILEGGNGQEVYQQIFGQNNPVPNTNLQEYTFRLHEHIDYGWQPHLSNRQFISILANLTAIKIRGTYTHKGKGYLDDVKLETAHRGAVGEPADWIENCECPKAQGYVGQFCESCLPGYHHDPPNGGPFASCVPCNCNGHADICESETGQCICHDNTAGSNCEHCARGFYGNPLKGTPDDCQRCPCPDNGPCILLGNNPDPFCSDCPVGRTGRRCEVCFDGYFGNPEKGIPCKPCECNNNIDLNAVRNCNQETGECLKCVNNTAGAHCEECLPGYYGDALSDQKEDGCKLCQCYPPGTQESPANGRVAPCDQVTGLCHCKPHVVGRNCDKCEDGYYHIKSGEGCTACQCDVEGSYNRTCDAISGQCQCRPGITGKRCDVCLPYQYGFSRDGCKPCDCDSIGSTDLQCDAKGQCPCYPNVEGRTCDRCKENKHDRKSNCVDCPPCYNLVQDAVNEHRDRLALLEDTLRKIKSNPTVINESGFKEKLKSVQERVKELLDVAKSSTGSDKKTLVEQLEDLRNQLRDIDRTLQNVDQTALDTNRTISVGRTNIEEAKDVLDKIFDDLKDAEDYLAVEGRNALNEAKKRAEHLGQQNEQMTAIALKARTVADSNLKEAMRIQEVAEQAKTTSSEAHNLARKVFNKYKNISAEIKFLKDELSSLEERYSEAKDLTASAVSRSEAVSKEALGLFSRGFSLPDVNVTDLQNQINNVTNEALQLKEKARILLQENVDSIRDIQDKVRNGEELLSKAEKQQSLTDDLLADVDRANDIAKKAVDRGEQTLLEAQDTLDKLSVFESEVQDAREKAIEARKGIDEISNLIHDASSKSQALQDVLSASKQQADRAREIAQEAQANANSASASANEIRREANKTKAEVVKLGNEADKLHLRVNTTDGNIRQYEGRIQKDDEMMRQVKQKVSQAKSSMVTASHQVNKAMEEINDITRELDALPDLDSGDLDRLERRLGDAEADIVAANLDARIRSLTDARVHQTTWVKNYEDEVNRLRKEVMNIEEISKVLPNHCFKNPRLEP
ncbi:hypothetical protein QAD02_006848 [Eretmocerus hayati]|uniref:Uncharacterized protein n=1 Tax=Eretmocerus hayati TaxID=131215 RepID=A0ACC2N369_9HYME|nr:hypothetical protein QAD02_006848 [Eretmocerus hayati]